MILKTPRASIINISVDGQVDIDNRRIKQILESLDLISTNAKSPWIVAKKTLRIFNGCIFTYTQCNKAFGL